MTLTFRRAHTGDTTAAQQTYRRIMNHLGQTVDYPHWHSENHPTPEEVVHWVEAGELYLALDEAGAIVGVTVLNHDTVDGYGDAAWSIAAQPHEVLVVHALGVVPDHLGKGVSRFLVDSTLEVARALGCTTVRLDTYVENIPARKLYERYGFTDLGCHTLTYEGTDLSEFHLFEYVL